MTLPDSKIYGTANRKEPRHFDSNWIAVQLTDSNVAVIISNIPVSDSIVYSLAAVRVGTT